MQFVAVYCTVLACSQVGTLALQEFSCVLPSVAVSCSVLQCVVVCCSVLHCFAVCCLLLQRVALFCSVLQVLQRTSALHEFSLLYFESD